MNDWINHACDEVDRLTAQQPYYQELEAQRKSLEPTHQRILDFLPEEDREALIDYEYLLSELAYQKTQTAYYLGRRGRLQSQDTDTHISAGDSHPLAGSQ